jgi:MOSC domain-containing protein
MRYWESATSWSASIGVMPRVSRLNIAPVRSLGLQSRDEVRLEANGVAEDRRFFVADRNNRLVDQHVAATMVQVSACTDPDATVLRLTFPDGHVVEDEVRLAEPIETPIYGRTGVGHVVDGPFAAALGAFIGKDVVVVRCDRPGGTRLTNPVTLVTDGSLDALGTTLGVGAVDPRRFRMLVDLDGGGPHEEDGWIGGRIGLGETILRISGAVARCAMTTHDPTTGERDLATLHAIKAYRGLVDGKDLMFGVFGQVERPGTIRVGDEVKVLEAQPA